MNLITVNIWQKEFEGLYTGVRHGDCSVSWFVDFTLEKASSQYSRSSCYKSTVRLDLFTILQIRIILYLLHKKLLLIYIYQFYLPIKSLRHKRPCINNSSCVYFPAFNINIRPTCKTCLYWRVYMPQVDTVYNMILIKTHTLQKQISKLKYCNSMAEIPMHKRGTNHSNFFSQLNNSI